MDYTLRINQPSEQVIPELLTALRRHALRTIITFDLQLARAGQESCGCPHHGTENCTCQYAVLLVYDPAQGDGVYRTITIHGRDEQVWLSLLRRPASTIRESEAHKDLEQKLLNLLLSLPSADQLAVIPDPRLSDAQSIDNTTP